MKKKTIALIVLVPLAVATLLITATSKRSSAILWQGERSGNAIGRSPSIVEEGKGEAAITLIEPKSEPLPATGPDFEYVRNTERRRDEFLAKAENLDNEEFLSLCAEFSQQGPFQDWGSIGSYAGEHRREVLLEIFDIFANEDSTKNSYDLMFRSASREFVSGYSISEIIAYLESFSEHPGFILNSSLHIGKRIAEMDDPREEVDRINKILKNSSLTNDGIESVVDGVVGGLSRRYPVYALDVISRVENPTSSTVNSFRNSAISLVNKDRDLAFSLLEKSLLGKNEWRSFKFADARRAGFEVTSPRKAA